MRVYRLRMILKIEDKGLQIPDKHLSIKEEGLDLEIQYEGL